MTSGSLTSTVGAVNPFRYRGYYYDTETGLYYLNSRYYNPEWCRFINADGIIGANGDIISQNLFAYCSNNPVNFYDPSGMCSQCYDAPKWKQSELLANCKYNTSETNTNESKNSYDWVGGFVKDVDGLFLAGFFAKANDLPYWGKWNTVSDAQRWGVGSYEAGVMSIFKQWEYGGIGVDVLTVNADLNLNGVGAGVNVIQVNGNIVLPLSNGQNVIVSGNVSVGFQAEAGALGISFSNVFGGGIKVSIR